MKKEYALNGLNCANCAAKIEIGVKSLAGVTSVSCNFINTTLTFEVADDHAEKITEDVEKIVRKYEPGIVVMDKEQMKDKKTGTKDNVGKRQMIQLAFGSLLFVLAILLKETAIQPYLFFASYAILSWRVVLAAAKNVFRMQFLDENFLMSIATIGAFIIGEFPEAVAVMLFYLVGEFFQDLAVRRSKKSIADLMDIRPDYANVNVDGELMQVSPDVIKVGDTIIVKPGEKIPLDGVVMEGESMLDTKALTGESVPRKTKPFDIVLSGYINQSGVLTIEVTKTFGESTVAKIIDLVENASSKKAPTENFITTFSKYYTPIVVGFALLLAVIPPLLLGGVWSDWIYRALVFLVISCPCALVVSIPLGFFGGIGGASRNGVLVKGGNYLEALNNVDIVVFDKTGTLTKGVFEVTNIHPAAGIANEELLEYAANAEVFSNHPIALSIMQAYGKDVDNSNADDYKEIAGYGISYKNILAGNDKLMKKEHISFAESTSVGTKVYVAVDGKYVGCIVISDEIKPDSRDAISALKKQGIRKTVMLTGDNEQIAAAISKELDLDEAHAQLLPDQKVEMLESLEAQKRTKGKLVFVGDGINDAPVLARADVGVAMGCLGSDAAIEAADVVLMTDEPSKLVAAIKVAKRTKRIVWQNIVFALGVKGIFLMLGAFGISNMWEAVFADVGVSVLAILNALRVVRVKV